MAAPIPGLLAAMLKAERLSGVLRWKVNFTAQVISGEAGLAGWDHVWLDTKAVKSEQDFVDVAANQIAKPELLGKSVAELINILFASKPETGICIAWTNWQELTKADMAAAEHIADLLDEACQGTAAVVIVCDSVGKFPGISELTQG